MAAELMVINPVRRKHKKRKSSSRSRSRYSNRRVSRVRRNPVAIASPSPTRRRSSRRRFARTASRARSYYRRAKGSNFGTFIGGTLIPAGVGAAGALALDMAWGRLPIPDGLKTGPLAPMVRIAGAVGIGMLVGAIAGKKYGEEAMNGALVTTLYDLAKGYVDPVVPATPATVSAFVDGLGYYSPAQGSGMGMFV